MKISKLGFLFLGAIFLLPGIVLAQEGGGEVQQDFSEEMGQFAQDLQNSSGELEAQAEEKISQQDQETMAAMETSTEETNEAFAESFAQQNSAMWGRQEDGSPPEDGGLQGAKDYLTNSSAVADGKVASREREAGNLNVGTEALTSEKETTIDDMAYTEVSLEYKNPLNEYVLIYEIDQIETLLDQKLDLMDGIMATNIETIDVPEDYGYNTETWQTEYANIQSQVNRPAQQRGVEYNSYNADPDRLTMVAQEAENLELLFDDVVKKEEKMAAMIENSAAIEEMGGIEMNLDELGEEVTGKLLSIDRQILDVLTEDAYEKDLAENEDLLVHELTGAPLKGYAKRKALKELGGVYGQVEDMRARNLEGNVLTEDEILGVMMGLYEGYNPYVN